MPFLLAVFSAIKSSACYLYGISKFQYDYPSYLSICSCSKFFPKLYVCGADVAKR